MASIAGRELNSTHGEGTERPQPASRARPPARKPARWQGRADLGREGLRDADKPVQVDRGVVEQVRGGDRFPIREESFTIDGFLSIRSSTLGGPHG